jgi:NADH:ubiquinone oxidoreductase subunit 4 (subunit M)
MYLSGFLVKTALYGFYKFSAPLSAELYTYFFSAVAVFGVLDSSLKM